MTATSPLTHAHRPKNQQAGGRSLTGVDALWPTVTWSSAHTGAEMDDTDVTVARSRAAGIDELAVHADAGHGHLLEQMR
jgi:hypothetical protein